MIRLDLRLYTSEAASLSIASGIMKLSESIYNTRTILPLQKVNADTEAETLASLLALPYD